MLNVLRWFGLLALSVPLAALAAHAFELPNKMALDGPLWLAVQQQLYRGWGPFVAPFELGAIASSWMLAYLVRARRAVYLPTLIAACCQTAMLAVFFVFNAPVNEAFAGWTPETLPPDWPSYRARWELGHLLGFVLAAAAFVALLRGAFLDWSVPEPAPRAPAAVDWRPFR
jgi:hypothetical protein